MNYKELIEKVDIYDVVGEHLDLKEGSGNKSFKTSCPFHSETNPSFYVNTELQIFKCFSCGRGGNALKFLQEYLNIDFQEALYELSLIAGVEDEKLSSKIVSKKQYYSILNDIHQTYQKTLFKSKFAIDFMLRRGITKETAKHFQLGFAPFDYKFLSASNFDKNLLNQLGLVTQKGSNLVDYFINRIIFPYFDISGRVIGFIGRTIADDPVKYLISRNSDLFHKNNVLFGFYNNIEFIKDKKSVNIVEGQFDVLSLYQSGVKNVVAMSGSGDNNQMGSISKMVKDISIFADGDKPGRENVYKVSKQLPIIPSVKYVDGKDPDEAIRSKETVEKFNLIEFLFKWFDEVEALTMSIDIANNIKDKIILNYLLRDISHKSRIEISRLESMLTQEADLGPLYQQKPLKIKPEDYFKNLKNKENSELDELKEKFKKTNDLSILKQIQNNIQEKKLGSKKK
tara:strand:- start:7219 stop:8583 length:1365 start_codon:yes stop_codon:yes gene_type:complete